MPTDRRPKNGLKSLETRLGALTVGEFLNTWRITEGLSLKDFGAQLGMSVANLCDVEKGRKGISPEKAESIAKTIGVPPALLVRLAIEEQLRASGLKYTVSIKPAA